MAHNLRHTLKPFEAGARQGQFHVVLMSRCACEWRRQRHTNLDSRGPVPGRSVGNVRR